VAHGRVKTARIESMLVPDRGDGLRGSTRHAGQGKRAITHVTAMRAVGRAATLCEVRLETGKTHQIRIHLSEAGHPLVGEKVYVRDFGGEQLPSPRLLLHAATLAFVHPITEEKLSFSSELPADFLAAMDAL
jgi:23S rRNA pseudouridine1911/1915/1917 synthase